MRKKTLMAASLAFVCLLALISCEDKVSVVELSGDKLNSITYVGEEVNYSGGTSEDIESVDIYYDQEFVSNSPVSGGVFAFPYTHLDLGKHIFGLKGLDASGASIAEANYELNIIEKSGLDGGDRADLFDFDFPALGGDNQGVDHILWATYYYLPQVSTVANGFALRDMFGDSLGPVLSLKHWCFSAMEGSVRVLADNGVGTTYNYDGTSEGHTVDCTKFFAWDVSKTSQAKNLVQSTV